MNQVSPESFFAPYDDIAVDVVSDRRPNTDVNLSLSNRELAENVCQIMGWQDFDLFEEHDFEKVHAEDDKQACLAYGFLSFLRWRVFQKAMELGVGTPDFNSKAMAYSEYWYIRLIERWRGDGVAADRWVN